MTILSRAGLRLTAKWDVVTGNLSAHREKAVIIAAEKASNTLEKAIRRKNKGQKSFEQRKEIPLVTTKLSGWSFWNVGSIESEETQGLIRQHFNPIQTRAAANDICLNLDVHDMTDLGGDLGAVPARVKCDIRFG